MKSRSTERKIKKKSIRIPPAPRVITKVISRAKSDQTVALLNTVALMAVVSALILSFAMYSVSVFYLLWK